jgi:serine protease AprX
MTSTLVAAAVLSGSLAAGASPQPVAIQGPTPAAISAALPLGSMYHVVDQIGARSLWRQGIDGSGVNIAVIDTGTAPVPALAAQVVAAVDLSAEAGVPEARYLDTFGHGTHMAGIIAGATPGADPATSASNPQWFLGVAPRAGIVSVKVGDNTGSTDISQVIAGVDWVIDHAKELDIEVLNLSYSSGSTLPYTTDPLTHALERAWRAGIVVVVAAGNDGRGQKRLASPAIDPYVIAVAGAEPKSPTSFKVPSWATSGDNQRSPDLTAPGSSVLSLRSPNSRIDLENPSARVGDELFKGTGSSQAAAVVAGAAALLLDARPGLTPDQVKAMLVSSANRSAITPPVARFSGAGMLRVDRAVGQPAPTTVQTWPASTGTSPLDAARTTVSPGVAGQPVTGNTTVLGTPWEGARWTGARWTGGSWDGASWTGGEWMGVRWTGASWTGARWTGASWTGASWTGASWTGARWTGASWTGASWTGASWTGARWTGASWTGARWTGSAWTGARWT